MATPPGWFQLSPFSNHSVFLFFRLTFTTAFALCPYPQPPRNTSTLVSSLHPTFHTASWLMVLRKDVIEVHSQPKNGKYQKVQRLKRGKTLISPTIPALSCRVEDLLG